jgi:GntR family transcriptional regulator
VTSPSASSASFADRLGPFDLDEGDGTLYRQIADLLAAAIADGRLLPGDRLPAERDLGPDLGVSRDTVRQALAELQRRGLVNRTVGRTGGTFVAEPKLYRDLTHFSGLADDLRGQNITDGARVLSARARSATPTIASALSIPPGTEVYEINRVRYADGRAVALELTTYAAHRYPGLLAHDLAGSLHDVLRTHYGEVPKRAVEYLEAILAGPQESEALEVEPGAPLMYIERIAYAADGTPVEFGRDIYRGDRTRMVVWGDEKDPRRSATR